MKIKNNKSNNKLLMFIIIKIVQIFIFFNILLFKN